MGVSIEYQKVRGKMMAATIKATAPKAAPKKAEEKKPVEVQ